MSSALDIWSRTLVAHTGRLMEPGHSVDLVHNEKVFDAMEALILGARKSLHILMYIWKPGRASDRVLRALEEARRAQVAVRVVVDRWGSRFGFVEQVQPELEAMGCEVRVFHPPGRVSLTATLARTHRKIVVADGATALVGGWCIWDTFLEGGEGGEEVWRDSNAVIRGPSVRWMQEAFLQNWREAGGDLPPLDQVPWPERDAGDVPVGFIHSSSTDRGGTGALKLLGAVLPQAKRRLWISSAYFAPDEDLLTLINERGRNGVDVRVLVPGPVHDVPLLREAGRSIYPRLFDAGVRVFEFQPTMMHAKTLVVDDALSVVGSINLEPMSVRALEEAAAVFWSEELNASLAADFLADLERAKEIRPGEIPLESARPLRHGLRSAWTTVSGWLRRRRTSGGAPAYER